MTLVRRVEIPSQPRRGLSYCCSMERHIVRRSLTVVGLTGFMLAFTACGSSTETGLEQLIESQGGGDVDLDLDGDGGLSIQTEEGGMSIDEDGNFVVTDEDGNVVTGDVDAETGEFNMESEDGSFSTGATTDLPEEWPDEVPAPDGLSINSATVIGSDSELTVSVAGSSDGESFVDSYASALEGAGFTEDSSFTADGTINNNYSNDQWVVNVGFFGSDSDNQTTISIFPAG